ncbi:phosphate signaling complex PhoU family protein [Thermococcus piezophilus]|uniref:PhoU family transcriptional regulator n=1 Tax=Thermococcus piezophilus TaxID=1712654 RepID=A0A172WJF5_9EURY|nr:phosphate uptake regulator PhoU [Thermococcus piezophilus]ANF23593.1 PhoU family transcriptional regulator [Thermococcus piezophilus]
MRKLLDIGIEQMKKMIGEMADGSLEALGSARKSLEGEFNSTGEIASKLHILRLGILDLVTELLIRYSPVAGDLRYIQSAIDVSYDLYRISRYAMEIERTVKIVMAPVEISLEAFPLTEEAVKISVEAFSELDETLVGRLIEIDRQIDRYYLDSLMALRDNPKKAVDALIMRHLERICDHANEIGARVVYIREGKRW